MLELERAYNELELLVREKTTDLAKVNEDLHLEITERNRVEEALRKAHAKLERRVALRTAELAMANEQLKQEIGERRRTEEELRVSRERLRRLAQQVVSAQEGERQRLSRALHDESVLKRLWQRRCPAAARHRDA